MRGETRKLALGSIFSALAVLLLCLGGIIPLSTYACPILASLAVGIVGEECGGGYGCLCWAAASGLTLLLSPDKEAALLFVFLGYYPLLKPRIDALGPAARVCAKLGLCALAVGAMYTLLIFVFRLDAVVKEFSETVPALLAATLILGIAVFFTYDLALTRLTALYRRRKRSGRRE